MARRGFDEREERTIDFDACTATVDRRDTHPFEAPAPGCGGFGEIPLRNGIGGSGSLTSRTVAGATTDTFTVHAEKAWNGDLSIVATVPRIDAPALEAAPDPELSRFDHFELVRGVGPELRRAFVRISGDRQRVFVDAPDDPRPPKARMEAGRLVVTFQYDVAGPIPATLGWYDGDGRSLLGISASGPLLDGAP